MTEHFSSDEGRLDLRALDADPDIRRSDAVVAAVMARILARHAEQSEGVVRLLRARRYVLAVAAMLVAIATAAVYASPQRSSGVPGDDVIASWTESLHVPTNGELLATYHGYRP
jgi:hypothetical protein